MAEGHNQGHTKRRRGHSHSVGSTTHSRREAPPYLCSSARMTHRRCLRASPSRCRIGDSTRSGRSHSISHTAMIATGAVHVSALTGLRSCCVRSFDASASSVGRCAGGGVRDRAQTVAGAATLVCSRAAVDHLHPTDAPRMPLPPQPLLRSRVEALRRALRRVGAAVRAVRRIGGGRRGQSTRTAARTAGHG
jgi:hypothetical protein